MRNIIGYEVLTGAYILAIGPLTIDKDDGGRYVKVSCIIFLTACPVGTEGACWCCNGISS
jgi:hypothetical protein